MKTILPRLLATAALAAVLLLLLAGCVSTGRNFDESKITDIKKGETTEADLVKLFGPPESRSSDSDGHTHLDWSYMESRMKGQSFIPYAGAFMGGSDSKHKMLMVTLGADGKVTHYNLTGGASETRQTTQDTPKK